jgi:hypothetical protein
MWSTFCLKRSSAIYTQISNTSLPFEATRQSLTIHQVWRFRVTWDGTWLALGCREEYIILFIHF